MTEQRRPTVDELHSGSEPNPAEAVTTGDPLGADPERPRASLRRRVSYDLPEPGDLLDGRYEVLSILGEGGFGIVYKARQRATGQLVAVKVLLPDHLNPLGHVSDRFTIARERFRREMRIVGELRHRNIVRLIDSGELDGGMLYMVLEFIEGEELSRLLHRESQQGRVLPPVEVRRLMLQVLSALAHAHERGYIHRDLKPQNIMITSGGLERDAVVLDFGIAGISEDDTDDPTRLTRTRQAIGTVSYMAPEQLNGRKALATDIYAWGLIFLECLTGQPIVTGDTPFAAVAVHLSPDAIALPAHIARHPLGRILARAIAKPLEERYASVEEVYRDLQACDVADLTPSDDAPEPPRDTPEAAPEPPEAPPRASSRPLLLAALAALLLTAGLLAFWLTREDDSPQLQATATEQPDPTRQTAPVEPVTLDLRHIQSVARRHLSNAAHSAVDAAIVAAAAAPEVEPPPAVDPVTEFARLRTDALERMRNRQFAEAATLFEQAFALHDDPDALSSWALALEKSGQHCAALEKYQRTIDLGVGSVDLARARVVVLTRQCEQAP